MHWLLTDILFFLNAIFFIHLCSSQLDLLHLYYMMVCGSLYDLTHDLEGTRLSCFNLFVYYYWLKNIENRLVWNLTLLIYCIRVWETSILDGDNGSSKLFFSKTLLRVPRVETVLKTPSHWRLFESDWEWKVRWRFFLKTNWESNQNHSQLVLTMNLHLSFHSQPLSSSLKWLADFKTVWLQSLSIRSWKLAVFERLIVTIQNRSFPDLIHP